jgi:hypothetical protein
MRCTTWEQGRDRCSNQAEYRLVLEVKDGVPQTNPRRAPVCSGCAVAYIEEYAEKLPSWTWNAVPIEPKASSPVDES